MERNDKRTESILKGAVIGLLCLVLLVCGLLCFTWHMSVPEQGSVRQQETSAPPPETPAATDSEPAADVPAEEPEALETEVPTTPVKNDAGTSDKKPVVQKPNKEQTKETEPTLPEATKPAAPAQTEPVQPEETEAPVEETEPPIEENKALQASGQVNAENNVVMEDTSFSDNGVSAQVPAGTLLEKNTTELVLTITEKDSSDSGVALEAGQAMRPLDVHMEGISQANTQPIQVCLGKVLPNGMNIGNVTLYHVENGTANAMTQVLTMTDLDAHNEFYYDPATGDTTVAMASFSEVAVVSDTGKEWNGEYDYTWYSADATELTIANADQLVAFGRIVSGYEVPAEVELPEDGYDSFNGKIVKLTADVNLADKESENNENLIFYPIGYYYIADQNGDGNPYSTVYSFEGTFDGQGHTVANFYQNTWEMKGDDPYYDLSTNHYYNDAMGLFGYVVNGTVKNLTVDNFSSDGEFTPTGVIAAYAVNSEFENIAITNCNPRVYNTGNGGIVGIGGNSDDAEDSKLTFTNITIDNTNKISALWGSWDVACGGLVGMFRGAGHVYMTNCHVAAQIDVYNDVCGNYQYYWYRYSGMLVGTNKNMATDENGYTVPETEKFHAENCTVHFGEWNDYYYCELVANSLASYTHDHQFSRLEQISSLDEIKSGDTWTKTGNFLLIDGDTKTCYHIVKAEDGTMKQHLHTDAGAETSVDVNGDGVIDENDLKEDKQIVYLPFNQLFTGYGWGVKHIPVYNGEDYAFDGVAVLDREVGADSVQKFASTGMTEVTEDETITIGTLFSAVTAYEDEIVPKAIQIAVTDLDETGVTAEFTRNDENWAAGTLTFTGTGRLKVTIQDYYFCTPTSITLTVNEPANVDKFDLVFENTDDYLYRVGNANTVALSSLFAQDANYDGTITSADVTIEKVAGTASGAYTANDTWANGTIQFSGTGVVKVTITDNDYCTPTELYLEVVDAKNITTATGSTGTNVVLLNNVKIQSGSSVTYNDSFVYGNGFTYDVRGGLTKYVASQGWGIINLSNGATLDNLVITGDVYGTYGAYSDNDYNTAAVASLSGTIQNCWISNCAAPVMLRGSTTIKDTTFFGGTVANAIIKGGVNILENVTTVNYNDDRAIVGAGIVIHSDADEKTELILNGILKQYNFLCETPEPTDSNAKILYDAMFDDSCSNYQFGTTPNRYVNTGIISMTEAFGADNITDNASTGYTGQSVAIKVQGVNVNGFVYTHPNTVGSVDNNYDNAEDNAEQGDYLPAFTIDLGDQEISYDGDSDSRYLYGDANGVKALYQDGDDALTLNLTNLASVTKYGQSLAVTAVCKDASGNTLTATNGAVTLSTSGTYTLVFTATDNIFYNADGTKADKSVTRTYTVPLSLSVKAADIKNAVVTISPTTLEGSYETVNLTDYKLKLEFLKCISVTDYTATNTNGSPVELTANISTATLTNSSNDVWSAASVITITYTDGRVLTVNLSKFAGSSPGTKTASVVTNGGVYFLTDGALNNKPTEDANKCTCTITSVSFKGNNGATITNDTDVSVSWPVESSSSGSCVTGDTMITLADGTQTRVDALTGNEELLVWNLETGSYDTAPIVFIDSDAETEYEVVNLYFSDGSKVGVIYEHGFFDYELGEYVYLDASNAENYIGRSFVTQGDIATGTWNTATLTDVVIEKKVTTAYSPVTFSHLCYYTDGVLSMPGGIEGLFNIFEVDTSTMAYDAEKKPQDIETYGLYTYEDFADMIPEEAFHAFNGAYLKVAIGKGMLTWEEIEKLAERYVPLM